MAKWQNLQMCLALYSASVAISIRRMVCMSLYIHNSSTLTTCTSRLGVSQRCDWNEYSQSRMRRGCERPAGLLCSCVVSADVWMLRIWRWRAVGSWCESYWHGELDRRLSCLNGLTWCLGVGSATGKFVLTLPTWVPVLGNEKWTFRAGCLTVDG